MALLAMPSRISTGGGPGLPRNGSWPNPAASRRRHRPLPQRQRHQTSRVRTRTAIEPTAPTPAAAAEPVEKPPVGPRRRHADAAAGRSGCNGDGSRAGPAFADPIATTSFAACGSRPIGQHRRRSSCGAGRSDQAGRPSRSRGDLLYTQEQRGDDEIVACYNLTTGKPVWMHRDATRFWESNGGAGPRATPTLSNGRVYTFGATGILNALDARDGSVVWSRNAASDTGKQIPGWGFASSPLVVGDLVVVHAGVLVAYDRATGERRWIGPARGGGYSSPHLLTIDGVAQILMMSGAGATSVAPADGTLLWEHSWPGSPIVQPAQIADGAVLISTADGMGGIGTRRIAVAHGPGGWTVEERWTSNGLKPYFNDFVVHKGHAFGFDGSILACIDLEDGKRKWKGGRYGNGQLVLLPDQDLLLVLSEDGELALVGGNPRPVHRARAVSGARGQDLEPPGAGRRRPAGSQRRGDGRVPAGPRGRLTGNRRPSRIRRLCEGGPLAFGVG